MSLNNPSRKDVASTSLSLDWYKQLFSRQPARKTRRQSSQSANESALVNLEARVLLSGTIEDVSTDFTNTNSGVWLSRTELNGALYFITNSNGQNALHRYTSAQGVEIVNLQYEGTSLTFGTSLPATGSMANVNGALYFIASHSTTGVEVFKLDQNGVVSLASDLFVGVASSSPANLTAVGDTLYLTASGGNSSTGSPAGNELWRINSNGSAELVSDLYAGGNSSNISNMTVVGGTLYFSASAGSTTGRELWKVDSLGQVVLVADLQPGSGSSDPANLTDVGGELYFTSLQRLWHLNSDGSLTEIKSTTDQTLSSPTFLVNSNGTLYFTAQTTQEGRELWRITSNNQAELVVDFTLGNGSSTFDDVEAVGSNVYVVTTRSDVGRELWKVVPTGLELVIDLNIGPSNGSPSTLTNVNGTLYFTATDTTGVLGLWRINPAGDLQRLTTITAPHTFGELFAFNNVLIFLGSNDEYRYQYWSVDDAGQIKRLTTAPRLSTENYFASVEFNGRLYYTAYKNGHPTIKYIDAYGNEITLATGMSLSNAVVAGQYVYFTSNSPTGQSGNELWRMDAAGTITQISDLNPDSGSSSPMSLTVLDGMIYFTARTMDIGPDRLFRLTNSGVVEQVGNFLPRALGAYEKKSLGISVNGHHFFAEYQNDGTTGIWRLDSNGTLNKISNSRLTTFYQLGEIAYFSASNSEGPQLWKIYSDGSAGIVAGISPSDFDANSSNFAYAHGTIYFTAATSTHGNELWKFDEFNNPVRVTDIIAGTGSSNPESLLVDTDGVLYFITRPNGPSPELWKIAADGIPVLIAATTATDLHILHNGGAYFSKTISGSVTLWRIDLTTGSEQQVFSVSNVGSSGHPDDFYSVGDELIFTANDGIHGIELWRINPDLSAELVKDFREGNSSSSPRYFFEYNDEIYFSADDFRGTVFAKYTNATPSAPPIVADQEFTIPENSANGTVVGTVVATDPDAGQLLTYSIADGNLSGAFEIDRYTGQIRVKDTRVLNFEYGVPFKLRIEVKDSGKVRESSFAEVTINLSNIDESPQLSFTLSGSTIINGSVVDLGRFTQFADQTFTFLVRNTGNFAAYLSARQTLGSGITFTIPSNVNLLPGQSVSITLRVNSWLLGESENVLNLTFQGGEIEPSEYNFTFETEVIPDPQLELPTIITPETQGSFTSGSISGSIVIGGETYLVANAVNEIWKIDTDGELSRVISTGLFTGIGGLAEVQNSLHFMATDALGLFGIWKIDPSGNSVLVKDLTGFTPVTAGPNSMAEYAGRIYFVATDATNGSELWALNSNGSVQLIADIYSGTGSSSIRDLTVVGNALYMSGMNQLLGRELWRYTTTVGIELVGELSPGTSSTSPGKFVAYGGELYFLNAVASPTGTSLSTGIWKVNSEGKIENYTIFPGIAFISKVKLIGDSLYVQNSLGPARITEYNLLTGSSRTFNLSGSASDYTVIDGRFFYTTGNSIYEWSEENGAWLVAQYNVVLTDILPTDGAFYVLGNSTFEGRELWKFTPHAPHSLSLSGTTVEENQPPGTAVGELGTTDPDSGDTFVYSLVSGIGSADNAAFTIVGNELRANVSFDYEIKSSYSIRVRTTDQSGLFFEKTFTISVTDIFELPPGGTLLTNLRYGVGGTDNATGVGYMMYSQQNVRTRFSGLDSNNANNFINVRYDGGQWQYDNNLTWVNFTPTSTDVLVASIDFTTDTVTMLKGNFGIVNGISMGYLDGDLLVTANQWKGQANAGEFEVSGRFISFAASTPLNNLRFGVAAIDNATGTGYLMYSQQSLQSRFPGINSTNASNFINVRLNGSQWQYDNNSTWVNFTPTSTDVLVAELDFTADTVTMLEGNLGVVNGIVQGYLDSDLTITANAYNGVSNAGEYDLTGTYITFAPRTSLTNLRNGVGGTDNATGTGYMMYSQQNVRTRFSGLDFNNADNFVNVRLNGAQWQYDNNSTWVNFTPTSSDVLVAALDFTADTVDLLRGTFSTIQGIASGYLDGDLSITPNNWNGTANTGEYHLTGTFITFMPTV
ncbi:cadherin domain-containing protein [Lacunimicrobium album]